MQNFAYIAKNAEGRRIEGLVSALSRRDALQRLRQQSLYPLTVAEPHAAQGRSFGWPWAGRVRKEYVADLCTQLADLLANGVPLLESLQVLAEATPHDRLRDAVLRIRDAVADGRNLDQAMATESTIFSELTLSMVRAGLEGAFLEDALQRTSGFLRKQDEMRAKVVGALTYPIILGTVGSLITGLMVTFLVPKFQPFFDRLEQTGSGLPMITVILLSVSHGLMRYGWLLPIMLALLFAGARRFNATPWGREWIDRWKLRIPGLGAIFHDAAVSRACRVLGTLLHNGVPILKSLRISSESTGNRLLEKVMLKSADNITSGDSLSKPLAASGLIPPPVMAMIRIAEEANTMDQVLVKIADRIDQKIERRLEVMVRMIEPLMLVLIGGMVMFVIVGVLLPVFDLNSAVD
ncbi:MAG: type II secretion system F family protein [Planctomycetes bacterium]|nr:type II secretion system F family protein [Planctomycetota bacterium]